MDKHAWLLLFAIFLMANTKQLFQIEQRFKERSSSLEKIVLPDTLLQSTMQQELALYAEVHESKQFKHFKTDPEYSSQILLKRDGVWNQSIFFSGKQLNNLLVQVTVMHKGETHKHDKDAISLYLINTATNEFLFTGRIRYMKLLKYQVDSELYELRVAYDWSNQIITNATDEEEVLKHISINIDIDPILAEAEESTQKDERAASDKLAVIKNETDRIFMSSLQIWDEIQVHHREFYRNQEQVYLRAYFELVVVFAANLIELLLLRRTLKLKTII